MVTEILMAQLLSKKVGAKLTFSTCGSLVSNNRGFFDVVRQVISPNISLHDVNQALRMAKKIEKMASDNEIHILIPSSHDFPNSLKTIPSPPVILYAKGNISALSRFPAIAVVGTRQPTSHGLVMSKQISTWLAQRSYSVISGLALGCDTAAHLGALEARGKTTAILAHGLDTIYPAINSGLARRIVESGGCLLSEHAPGVTAQRHYFPARNRLQSGLSQGVVIIECGVQSGTMHTAKFCMQQNKPLASLVYPEALSTCVDNSGNKLLIKRGAYPFKTVEELEKWLVNLNPEVDSSKVTEESYQVPLHLAEGNEQLLAYRAYIHTKQLQSSALVASEGASNFDKKRPFVVHRLAT